MAGGNIKWLFGGKGSPIAIPDGPKGSTPKAVASSIKPVSIKTSADNPYLVSFGNKPAQYVTPMGGALAGAVPASGGAGYMFTPVEAFTGSQGGGGGYYTGGGGGGGSKPIKWASTYSVEGAPEWWQGLTPSSVNAESSYLSMVNAMIPYMSPEDQLATLQYFATAFPTGIGETYSPAAQVETGNIPTDMTSSISDFFTSAGRAEEAKTALDTMIEAIATKTKSTSDKVKKNLGEGYKFLTSVLDTIQKFGGAEEGERQTRAQYQQMLGQLDPLLALGQAQQFGAMQPIAQKLTQPFFTAGQITPTVKVAGVQRFGAPSPKRF